MSHPDLYAETILDAIKNRTTLLVHYNDEVRPIEPHAYGRTRAGNPVVRVWQLAGGSISQNPVPGWRLMRVDRIQNIEPMDTPSLAPRAEYNPDDAQMAEILARV